MLDFLKKSGIIDQLIVLTFNFFTGIEEIIRPSWNICTSKLNLFFRTSGFTELISVGKIHEIAHAIFNFKRHFETGSESSELKML